jgi:hypothetical protein
MIKEMWESMSSRLFRVRWTGFTVTKLTEKIPTSTKVDQIIVHLYLSLVPRGTVAPSHLCSLSYVDPFEYVNQIRSSSFESLEMPPKRSWESSVPAVETFLIFLFFFYLESPPSCMISILSSTFFFLMYGHHLRDSNSCCTTSPSNI